ncbi:Endonuclease exonuclease phosphatase, partial [Olea europaea subsp. europaea]
MLKLWVFGTYLQEIILDVRNPILTGFWLRLPGLNDIWIEFRYKKLGQFCYKCGRIGNHYFSCKFSAGKAKFGPWLRALPWYEANASLIQYSSSLGVCILLLFSLFLML